MFRSPFLHSRLQMPPREPSAWQPLKHTAAGSETAPSRGHREASHTRCICRPVSKTHRRAEACAQAGPDYRRELEADAELLPASARGGDPGPAQRAPPGVAWGGALKSLNESTWRAPLRSLFSFRFSSQDKCLRKHRPRAHRPRSLLLSSSDLQAHNGAEISDVRTH